MQQEPALTCGERLAQLLAAYGIDVAFGIPGTHTIELYRGIPASGIRHVTPRHEQGAGFMADGYARASGRPAACFTVSGPGALNIATAMGQALNDSIPMLVISADNATYELGLGEGRLHETRDLRAAMAEVSVWSHRLLRANELDRVLARAFAIFHSARPGPVHISVPQDVITADASRVDSTPWPLPARPGPDPRTLEQMAKRLNHCERPVLALGGGALAAATWLPTLAETLDAPVTLTHNARGLLPPAHPLLLRDGPFSDAARALYAEADVVLAIGTELGETDYDFNFDGGLRVPGELLRIDIDMQQLCRGLRPTLALPSDAGLAVEALLAQLDRADRDGAARVQRAAGAHPPGDDGFEPFLDTLQGALPDAVLVGDSTLPAYAAAARWHPARPRSFASAATGYGTLGYALPAAIGARLGSPERPVIALLGDGGLQFTLPELASAVEAGVGIAVVLWNNRQYGMIARNFEDAGMSPIACDIYTPDLVAAARAMGCEALAVDSHETLGAALTASATRDVPTLIEVSPEHFLAPAG